MPDFIESLADVQEDGGAIVFVVQGFVYYICESMALLYIRVCFPESKSVCRYPRLGVRINVYPFE